MDLDRIDVGILRALQDDARLSYRDLARRIGVSVPTISARVANLKDLGVLTGFHAAVDPERLRQPRVVVIVRTSASRSEGVGKSLAEFPEVRWTVGTEGSRIVAEVVLPRSGLLNPFLRKVRALAGVLSVEHHVATKALKDEPRAVINPGVSAALNCFECGRVIEGAPVRVKLDGRNHYLCCSSCERLYVERYRKIRAAARAPRRT